MVSVAINHREWQLFDNYGVQFAAQLMSGYILGHAKKHSSLGKFDIPLPSMNDTYEKHPKVRSDR